MIRRVLVPGLLAVAVYYALFGGEYTLFDVQRTQGEMEEARVELAELQEVADSLRARADSLEHDPRVLETLARERFGMIRDGEVLYRFAEPVPDEEEDGGGR